MSAEPFLFDDLSVGLILTAECEYHITRDEIVEVASRWDPQPFHLDEEAAASSHFGGLVASGLHTLAASMQLGSRERPATAAVAGLGLDELRILAPVRPGDRLRQTTEIVGLRPSASRPDRGIVRGRRIVRNQEGTDVLTYLLMWMVRRAAHDVSDCRTRL